jgi:hypothetical protein
MIDDMSDDSKRFSRVVWDQLYDLEPVARDDLVFAVNRNLGPGVRGDVIRTYANQLRRLARSRGTEWDDTQVTDSTWVSKAMRFYVIKWIHGRRAAGQIAQGSDGRWASTDKPPQFRDDESGELVAYTPEYARKYGAAVLRDAAEIQEHMWDTRKA